MEKNLTYANFAETAEANMTTTTYVDYCGYSIEVKNKTGISGIVKIVDTVVESCFDGDEYIVGAVDVLTKAFIIDEFTNIDIPDDVNQICAFVYGTDIWNIVRGIIDAVQLDVIERAIRKKIDYVIGMRGDSINNKCIEVITSLSDASEKMNDMFNSFDKDDIEKLMSAVSDNKIDEVKLMKAYMKEKK